MYVPRHFVETDPVFISDFIQNNAFGALITWDGQRPVASHLLMIVAESSPKGLTLIGHLARANPQWKSFDPDGEALAIFQGPHCYVSAGWYSIQSAPTWNYVTVHAYGKLTIVDERMELRQLLKDLVESQERSMPEEERYQIESMPKELFENMMDAVVGFRFHTTRVECAVKLSQNRSDRDQQNIISNLRRQGDPGSEFVADAMEDRKTKGRQAAE